MYWNKSKNQQIVMRGHHIKQIINYFQNQGLNKNYRTETIKAMIERMKSLKNKKTLIKFVNHPSNICKTCNLKRYEGCKINNNIVLETDIAKRDEKIIQNYGLKLNTWYQSSKVLNILLTKQK